MGRYNLDKERLKKLEKMQEDLKKSTGTLSKKQMEELSILRAQEAASVMDIPREKLESMASYIESQAKLERATKADLARLIVIKERLLIEE